jgi:hypothetical protein
MAPAAQFCGGCGIPVTPGENLTTGPSGADTATMAISATELGAPGPDDPWDWEPRRRVLPWVAAVVAVALIGVGIFVAAGRGDRHTSLASTARRKGPIAMPWVLTFKVKGAITLLAREGVDVKQILVRRVPRENVGPGTVVQQDPPAGMIVEDGVLLTVSRPPDKMPNFVGKGINAARATLSTLDVKLTVDEALETHLSDGTVLEQTPAGGTPFAKAVHLTVARRPIPTNLGDLYGTGSAPTKADRATIAATAYPDSLLWDVSVCPGAAPPTVTYELGGHYRKLVATAGLSADQDPADQVHLDLIVDGSVGLARNLDPQTPVPVDVDLTGHQQLVLMFTPIGGGDPNCATAQAALGRAHLLSTAQSR